VAYDDIVCLCDELRPKLQQAIESLDQVTVAEDDRELISENAAVSKSSGYGEFLSAWNQVHRQLFLLALLTARTDEERKKLTHLQNNVRSLLNLATKKFGLLSAGQRAEILDLFKFRNVLVHSPEVIVPEPLLGRKLEELSMHLNAIKTRIGEVESSGAPPEVGPDSEFDDDGLAGKDSEDEPA